MKYLKMLGLAAVAAMAMMAFVGAGSASATVLCKTTLTEGCAAAGWSYPAGTEIHASLKTGTTAKLWADPKGTEPLVTCNESTVRGSIDMPGSSTETVTGPLDTTLVEGQHTGLHWGGCNHKTETITTTIGGVASIGTLEIHWIANTDNGTVTSKNTDVTVEIAGVTCTFGSGEGLDLGTLSEGVKQTLSINATVNKVAGSFLCPAHAIWEAEYTITSPAGTLAVSTS